jgi:hypothetical protein
MIEIANLKWIPCMAVINRNMDFIILPVGNINVFIFMPIFIRSILKYAALRATDVL